MFLRAGSRQSTRWSLASLGRTTNTSGTASTTCGSDIAAVPCVLPLTHEFDHRVFVLIGGVPVSRSLASQAQTSSSVRAIIVVTHTAPHRSLVKKGLYPRDGALAGFYCNSLMERIPEFDSLCKIRFWFFGAPQKQADLPMRTRCDVPSFSRLRDTSIGAQGTFTQTATPLLGTSTLSGNREVRSAAG